MKKGVPDHSWKQCCIYKCCIFTTLFQFFESFPKASPCQLWLKGKHPKIQDGVVSRTLCLKRECSTTYDVLIRKCTGSYVYNFQDFKKISSWVTFCFRNGKLFFFQDVPFLQ